MKKQLGLFLPGNPPATAKLVKTILNPYTKRNEYLYVYNGFLVIWRGDDEYKLYGQLEIPLPGVRWIVDVMEYGFLRKPSEGGLPKNKISTGETIAGEKLFINRAGSLAGEDIGGYEVKNLSRRDYMLGNQGYDITDKVMFEMGLLDFFKQLAERYEQGEFGPVIHNARKEIRDGLKTKPRTWTASVYFFLSLISASRGR